MKNVTDLPEWKNLELHQKHVAPLHMQELFLADPLRFSQFSLSHQGILFDYSKNRITEKTIEYLCQLAVACGLPVKIEAMFRGESVNSTEKRAALHTALRNTDANELIIEGKNVIPLIRATLKNVCAFAEKVRNGSWKGSSGKSITDVVNIGIGGSDLGPVLTTQALAQHACPHLRCHFISNIDAAHIHDVLNQIKPETTLFIVSSKSFSTLETLTNAGTIKMWLQDKLSQQAIEKHFVAITAAKARAIEFGILEDQIFPLWDWIGGRYSVWSAIGLPLAILIGQEKFIEFLQGAHEMDEHFRHAEFKNNMPVLLASLGIWYINFFGANNHAIVPYSHYLTHLRTYLQQADMESNGKNVSNQGVFLDYQTGPIIWGEQGCNAQHAFHQLLHQGQHLTPVDFILVGGNDNGALLHHQDMLVASGLSQAQALMQGKTYKQALHELLDIGYSMEEASQLAPHKSINGNRPSNVIFLDSMSPKNLGALLALYEHKIFVQGVIWNINSFDQWGVELGKQLLPQILSELTESRDLVAHDSSTQGLINHYKQLKEFS